MLRPSRALRDGLFYVFLKISINYCEILLSEKYVNNIWDSFLKKHIFKINDLLLIKLPLYYISPDL